MIRDPSGRAAKIAEVVSQTLNSVAILAAPKVARKLPAMPSRLSLLERMDEYLHALGALRASGADLRAKTEAHAQRLRALLAGWTPSPDIPTDIQDAARGLIEALGFPSPPGGWDNFEGAPDNSQASNDNGKTRIKREPPSEGSSLSRELNFLVLVLFALSSPKRLAQLEALPPREEIAEALEAFAEHVMAQPEPSPGSIMDSFRRAVVPARQLFERLQDWAPSEVPRDVTLAAREVMETLFTDSREAWAEKWAQQERA